MHFSTLHFVLSILPSTLAQYPGGGSGSSSTTSAAATAPSASGVHVVQVGSNGLSFSPNNVTAAVGDKIQFEFFAPEHSVAQSSFSSPCTPLNGTGFFSGLVTTSSGQNTNVFTVTINDTNPIWFYCSVPTHCQSGMAGVINPP